MKKKPKQTNKQKHGHKTKLFSEDNNFYDKLKDNNLFTSICL